MGELDEAYILHTFRFSDSKLIAEFYTRACGRVKTVARNPSKKNRSQYQPFQRLGVELKGQRELKTLLHCEALTDHRPTNSLGGDSLFCAMYVNELMQRLTPLEEPEATLFGVYETALAQLSDANTRMLREMVLRRFELELLQVLGYQINFFEQPSGESIIPSNLYLFEANAGFTPAAEEQGSALLGSAILAVGQRDFTAAGALQAAKRINRAALQPHLGSRPLKSRELFR